MLFSNGKNVLWEMVSHKGARTDPDSPRGDPDVRIVQRNVFLQEMPIADEGCNVLTTGMEAADCPSPDAGFKLLRPGTRGLGCCLLLPLQPKENRLLLDELGRMTIKVLFLCVYLD